MKDIGVVLPYWEDRPPIEAVDIATTADALGFAELWIGEMATFDAFALAGALADRCRSITMTIGPLAVGVRDPVAFALGIATVSEVAGYPVGLALGVSTPVVVERWHGRTWAGSTARLRNTVVATRALLAGEKVNGFRLRVAPPASSITVAAFGRHSIAIAAELADRMVINLVTVDQAAVLRQQLAGAVPLAAWIPVAVDPTPAALDRLRRALVAYLAAPGYDEMFKAAGYDGLVASARGGTHPKELFAAIPDDLLHAVGAIGDIATVRARLAAYRSAGVDHLAVVPTTTADLTALV
jgi:probable F420-dependent oxidoreductase